MLEMYVEVTPSKEKSQKVVRSSRDVLRTESLQSLASGNKTDN